MLTAQTVAPAVQVLVDQRHLLPQLTQGLRVQVFQGKVLQAPEALLVLAVVMARVGVVAAQVLLELPQLTVSLALLAVRAVLELQIALQAHLLPELVAAVGVGQPLVAQEEQAAAGLAVEVLLLEPQAG
jgi:hypothetical protein